MRHSLFAAALFFGTVTAIGGFAQTAAGQTIPPAPSADQATPDLAPEVADAEALIVKSDWKGAEPKLAAWLTAHPDDARALFDAGYVADALNHLDDALGFYRRAVQANPKSFEAHLSLGLLLARQGTLEEAKSELTDATGLDAGAAGPEAKARAFRALAEINRKDDPTEASEDLLQALKLTPETPEDTLLAAELADASGQPEAAEAAYLRLLAADPKSQAAEAGLAHLLIARKQFDEAETLLRAALQQKPDDATLTAQLATVLVAQDKAEAIPLLQKLHDAHPDDYSMTRMLAEVLAEAGDFVGSDHLYVQLLTAHPDDAGLMVAHGQNLIRQLKFAEALRLFTKSTELDPADPDGWSGLAFAASRTGNPSITLHALTMRSKYLPEVPSTYFLWATSYDSLHDRNAAITYYHHFLEAAAGKYPDQEWQAKQRLLLLEKK